MSSFCPSHAAIFKELDAIAPGAPFLALGQTALWDEPLKIGVANCAKELGYERRFIAGVHDTDYFAKHSRKLAGDVDYAILPHNDTTTRELWSAAGEISTLFGSETVVTREKLQASGAKLAKIAKSRPTLLDEITEAWGWRGVAFMGDETPVIAETALGPLEAKLLEAIDWAISESLSRIPGCQICIPKQKAAELRSLVCDAIEQANGQSLSQFFRALLPRLHEFVAGVPSVAETTSTTELLRFNTTTASLARFKLVDLFLRPETSEIAKAAYNDAVRHSEIYTLDKFKSWAIPFDLVVPGHGRGTLRIAPKAIIVMAQRPLFITTKKPVKSIEDLAAAIESKFGPNCTLVGKAVSLIGMLAQEHVFVFHEGASSYVPRSTQFHKNLGELCPPMNPILRIKYSTWDELENCKVWLSLPDPFRRPFGADDISSSSFGSLWRTTVKQQSELLDRLKDLRRPVDLVNFLSTQQSSAWSDLANRYEVIQEGMINLQSNVEKFRVEKAELLKEIRLLKQIRNTTEHDKGRHWRAEIFEKSPSPEELEKRASFESRIAEIDAQIADGWVKYADIRSKQNSVVSSAEIQELHKSRKDLDLEVELKRLRLVRDAVTVSKGLVKAGLRPSAWWFPLVCPDGGWYHDTVASAQYSLEHVR